MATPCQRKRISTIVLLILYGTADIECSLPVDLAAEEKGKNYNMYYLFDKYDSHKKDIIPQNVNNCSTNVTIHNLTKMLFGRCVYFFISFRRFRRDKQTSSSYFISSLNLN